MEVFYLSVCSWGIEEEDNIQLTEWKGVEKYREPIETTLISANFAAVFLWLDILIN